MKCGYCDKYDHLESSCPTKKGDRRTEVGMGCFFLLVLSPFWVIGMIAGFAWSAIKDAFNFGDGAWPQAWASVRGKKKDDGEQISG